MRFTRYAVVLFLALIGVAPGAEAKDADLLVFAAASLQESLTEAGDIFAAQGGVKPTLSFAASSALARQIENGAPAALFISADEEWMNYLADRTLILAETRKSFLGNSLVLVAPRDRPFKLKIEPGFALAKVLQYGMLAMGDPDAVPAGKYGKAALTTLGVWPQIEDHVARMDNVRSALALVERGEVSAGIVYATDAKVSKGVIVVDSFPETSHPPISYPLAIVKGHDSKPARGFRDFLLGPDGKAIFEKYGFSTK